MKKKIVYCLFLLLLAISSYSQNGELMKSEKRYIHPKSFFVSAGIGGFLAHNRVDDPEDFLHSGSVPSLTGCLMSEIGLTNNYYLEAGLSLETAFDVIKTDEFGTSGGNVFTSKKLSLGMSKRVTNRKNNKTYFNLHAGFAGSLHYNSLTDSAGFEDYLTKITSQDTTYFYTTGKGRYSTKLFPTIYVAIEKDFRISNSFFISLKYRRDQGFVKVYKQDIAYHYSNTQPSLPVSPLKQATASINGSANTITVGLKYRFLCKRDKTTNDIHP